MTGDVIFFVFSGILALYAITILLSNCFNCFENKSIIGTMKNKYKKQNCQIQISLINEKKEFLFFTIEEKNLIQLQGYDNNNKLIVINFDCEKEILNFLSQKLPEQMNHFSWQLNLIKTLSNQIRTNTNIVGTSLKEQFYSIDNLCWKIIRLIEKDFYLKNTIINKEITSSIIKFSDKALISFYYISIHGNNVNLINEIKAELNRVEHLLQITQNPNEKEHLLFLNKTHMMRLEEQLQINENLGILNRELELLNVNLIYMIEKITASISQYNLNKRPNLFIYDEILSSFKLPLMDQLFTSQSKL